jgi:hypothetical protein
MGFAVGLEAREFAGPKHRKHYTVPLSAGTDNIWRLVDSKPHPKSNAAFTPSVPSPTHPFLPTPWVPPSLSPKFRPPSALPGHDSAIVFPFVFHELKKDNGDGHPQMMMSMVTGLHALEQLRKKAEEQDPDGYKALKMSKEDSAMMERVYGLYISKATWTFYVLWWANKPGALHRKQMVIQHHPRPL